MVQRHVRRDLEQQLRASFTGGRPCAVEDFLYTFTSKGKAYKGISLGYCVGNYMSASWNLCLLYTSPSPRDLSTSRMPSSA